MFAAQWFNQQTGEWHTIQAFPASFMAEAYAKAWNAKTGDETRVIKQEVEQF